MVKSQKSGFGLNSFSWIVAFNLLYLTGGSKQDDFSLFWPEIAYPKKKKDCLSATAGKGKIGPLVAGPHLPSWGIILIKG